MWESQRDFPRAVGRVENLILVFHAFHRPSFQQFFSWFLDERDRQRCFRRLQTAAGRSRFGMMPRTRLFVSPGPPSQSSGGDVGQDKAV